MQNKRININLLNGIVDPRDMKRYVNPSDVEGIAYDYAIPHYPIMNSKLNVLVGEEAKRPFDYKVVVTNPEAITQKEAAKKQELLQRLSSYIEEGGDQQENPERYIEKLQKYMKYEWQDLREIRANWLLQHYHKELNIPLKTNKNFQMALATGEESYICDVVGGDLLVEPIDPLKISIFGSGSALNFEDADIIVIEDYWPLGRIIDHFYEDLKPGDIDKLESITNTKTSFTNVAASPLPAKHIELDEVSLVTQDTFEGMRFREEMVGNYIDLFGSSSRAMSDVVDMFGNIRVIRLFWKSRRALLKVKSFDPMTGEEVYDIYPETYVVDETKGEEATKMWANEAWEATLVHKDIYLRMGPRKIQYSRLSNPSKCHFGIIGSVYSLIGSKPYSMVDMMKPHNYLYNVTHDRLNTTMANSWGSLLEVDFASIPKGWDITKWFHFAKKMKLAIKDSFKEGNEGRAKNTLAGSFTSQSRGIISDNLGNYIEQNIRLLEYIKVELSEISGISKQREGQTSNRETFGGIERANLQSSYITEWYYMIHDDIKKRLYECMLETTKYAMRLGNMKFQHIVNDHAIEMIEIDGDEYSECDYGLVVDYSGSSIVKDKIEAIAQAAMQNQMSSFSTMLQIYNNNNSIADIQRIVEADEAARNQSAAQARDEETKLKQEEIAAKAQEALENRNVLVENNIRDNQTKILLKQIDLQAAMETDDGIQEPALEDKGKLLEQMREFDQQLSFEKRKHEDTMEIKREELVIKNKVANRPRNTP